VGIASHSQTPVGSKGLPRRRLLLPFRLLGLGEFKESLKTENRVFHYCNLPCNAEHTKKGTAVGRLLHPVAYDVLNHDCP
jgi:hypothetical protein